MDLAVERAVTPAFANAPHALLISPQARRGPGWPAWPAAMSGHHAHSRTAPRIYTHPLIQRAPANVHIFSADPCSTSPVAVAGKVSHRRS